ncbi:MAG: ATP-binding protein, partial [Blastocatellia bacterium]
QEHHETLHTIMRSGEHLLNLINDVLSLAKIESGKLTLSKRPFSTKELLNSIYNMFKLRAEAKSIGLKFDISETFPAYVFGDENKLQQVLINLLSNAIKFTDQGSVSLLADWVNGQAKFVVSDTGVGIEEQDIDSMFLPFFQTETASKITGSTGLGLAISRSLVKLMGGDININSNVGKGTTFSFTIEITPSPEDENLMDERKVLKLADDSHKFNILVVDNNIEHQFLLSQLLKSVNFQVDMADNGKQAFDKWQNNKFHLIFMDIRMPELNGVETTKLIRDRERAKNLPTIPIIALSANVFEQTRDTMFSAGCNDFINKPFRESELFNKLAEHLGVAYIYEELKEKTSKKNISIKERLLKLPMEWLNNFQFVLAKGLIEEAKALINQKRNLDPELFDELETLLKNYQFDEIDIILSERHTN